MSTTFPTTTDPTPAIRPMASEDIYKDVHKAIRVELFSVTAEAGRMDPHDACARVELAGRVAHLADLLARHAHHEDAHMEPFIDAALPGMQAELAAAHETIEARMDAILLLADRLVAPTTAEHRAAAHELYLELAAFTADYLQHQDQEERVVMPALDAHFDTETLLGLHAQIVGSIPPEVMADFLGLMIPAMNIDDRAALLGGMREAAPPEVFAGTFALAGSVLSPADHAALAQRLGVDLAATR